MTTDLLVKNEVNIESTEASLLTKYKFRDDPRLEQSNVDKITPDKIHLHLRSFPSVACARAEGFIEACVVDVWILFHPSWNCFHWFSKNCYYTAYHKNLVYVAWKHLDLELPVNVQIVMTSIRFAQQSFPIGALPPGRAEARETLGFIKLWGVWALLSYEC